MLHHWNCCGRNISSYNSTLSYLLYARNNGTGKKRGKILREILDPIPSWPDNYNLLIIFQENLLKKDVTLS